MTFKLKDNSGKQIALHILGCVAFLAFPILFTPGHPPDKGTHFFDYLVVKKVAVNLLLLVFFHFNYYWLIPTFYFKKKYLRFFSAIVLLAILLSVLPLFVGNNNAPPPDMQQNQPAKIRKGSPPWFNELELQSNFFLFAAVFFISLTLSINGQYKRAEKQKVDAELSLLKAQINPHFLFNTLNSIYSLALQKDERTPDAIVQLSELMRYIIRDAHNYKVPLDLEVNYIANYIALQRSRLGDTAIINYQVTGDTSGKKISPLILITFIENAFKHGVNPDEESAIDIHISITENQLHLKVANKKVTVKASEDTSNQIGISNAKDRLALDYANKHTLEITDATASYTVNLLIDLS